MSVSTIAKRFKRSVLIVVAAAVAIVTVPLTPANAVSTIPVVYDAVEPKTDTLLSTSPCTSLPTTGKIEQLSDSQLPGPYGNCSYVSAHYNRGDVDLPLSQIYVDGSDVVLVPQVSAAMQSNQNKVRLSIPLKSLDSNDSPIHLHYADTSTFRRIKLTVSSTTEGLNIDGKAQAQNTSRMLVLYRKDLGGGNYTFARNIDVQYPRFTDNEAGINSFTWKETSGTGRLQFTEGIDNSTPDTTHKTYEITYSDTNNTQNTVSAELSLTSLKSVTMDADVRNDQAVDAATTGFKDTDLAKMYPLDCGAGSCNGKFYDGWTAPFFYKVTSTRDRNRTDDPWYDAIFHRTGIPALPFNANTKGLWDFEKEYFTPDSGWDIEEQPARLVDSSVDMPRPTDSTTFDSNHDACAHANKYWTTWSAGWWTPGWLIDNHFVADSKWPITRNIQGKWSPTPDANGCRNVDKSGSDIGTNDSGKRSDVSFYVQYNGMPTGLTQAGTQQRTWSYFLDRVSVNGEWYDVPYPDFPKKPIPAVKAGQSCYGNGWSISGCGSAYAQAREKMLREPSNAEKADPKTSTATADIWENAPDTFRFCAIGTPDGQDKRMGRYRTDVFQPRVLVDRDITEGKNAGSHLKVELVNARTQGDLLADGMSRLDNTGKKVDRANRHHPSPAYGGPTQLTNNTTCFDPSPQTRSINMWNQWKTMYKITITGMVNPNLKVTAKYDYTSKSKVWVVSSRGAKKVEVKEASIRDHPDGSEVGVLSDTPQWRDRTTVGGSLEDLGCAKGKCDGAIADDMPRYPGETTDGNIAVTLKDGYINPRLTAFINRTRTAVCGTTEAANCKILSEGNVPLAASTDANSLPVKKWSDGRFHYLWSWNNEDAVSFDKATTVDANIGTATAQPIRVTSDLVSTPVAIMKTDSGAKATSETAADSKTVASQWNGDTLNLPTVDKESNYYLKVDGEIPAPQDGKAFTGYKLQGITAGGQVEQLMSNRTFYPGDAIDLRDVDGSGAPLVKLSNDSFDGPRYQELQLVPTFDTTSRGVPKLYNAAKYSKAGSKLTYEETAFNFFAAPGLTVNLVKNNYDPAENPLKSHPEYSYSEKDSTLTNTIPVPNSQDGSTPDEVVLKFVFAPVQVNIGVNYTWHNADNGNKPYSTVDKRILDSLEQYIPVTVIITKSDGTKIQVTKAPYSSSEGNYFGNNIGGFRSDDTISLSYSYELKNKIMCVVNYGEISKDTGKSGGVDTPATPTKLYGTNAQGTPQKFDTALDVGVNKFTVNIDSSCHQGVIVYPTGNIPVKYTSVNSDGRFLLPDSDSMWKQYPMDDTDGSPRFDGKFPDGQPKQWERFHRAVEHPTLANYDDSNPMVYNVIALTPGNTDTPVTMRKYTPLEPGDWKFSTDTMPLWKWRMHCPYFKAPTDENGKPIGSSVQPGKTTVCFLEAKTSEITILGDMPQYLRDSWIFTLQSDDGSDQDLISGEKVTGKVVIGSDNIRKCFDTCQYYPGKLQVAATNVKKIASSTPKFYMYNQNDENHNATTADKNIHDDGYWDELVKGEEVETWPAYRRWAADIHPDVLYKVTGDHRVEEEPTGEPKAVEVAGSQHIALKVVITPITNSTLPSAGGIGTTWKIVGIITLIAALFLAIVAFLKKRAMQ